MGTRFGRMAFVAALAIVAPAAALAQAGADLAGTWVLEDSGAGARGGGRGGGVPGFPLATQLVIKVSPAEVLVDSDTGSGGSIQTFVYKLDGSTTNVPGPLGWETTAKAAWQGNNLAVTVRRSITGPNGPIGANVTEVYQVSGNTLTIERSLGATTQKLVYRKKS